ncbi:MAG: hypothetical protein VYA51_10575 [Planctomycetota bacterium]|nr:hypothetical protein [Planctomycetota bacterium]MEC9048447.1 hypothetical protein [Planctomycetota bacterium]
MSYFRTGHDESPFVTAATCDHPEEVADGVVIERRRVFWLSAAGVAALLVGRSPRAQDPVSPSRPRRTGTLDYPAFLEELYPLAKRLVDSKGEDEEAYLMTVAAAMTRISDPKSPLREAMKAFRKRQPHQGERFPLAAMTIKLKPGKGFSHHDHLDYNGVIMGVSGEARVRNYDFVGTPPEVDSGKAFLVRETRDDLILPGRISTLGRNRDNVHDLIAGKDGAQVLDVFTFFSKRAGSRYLELDDKPRDAERRVYEASWRQRRRRRG